MKSKYSISPEAAGYLRTLRRIPADVRLSMATREIDMSDGNHCICGWALREAVSAAANLPAEVITVEGVLWDPPTHNTDTNNRWGHAARGCQRRWGGEFVGEWQSVYVAPDPLIEEAFAFAVMEAAEGRELVGIGSQETA